MNSQTVFNRMELLFWNFAIVALTRPSNALARMRKNMNSVRPVELKSIGVLLAVSGLAGLACGYLAFFLVIQMR